MLTEMLSNTQEELAAMEDLKFQFTQHLIYHEDLNMTGALIDSRAQARSSHEVAEMMEKVVVSSPVMVPAPPPGHPRGLHQGRQ